MSGRTSAAVCRGAWKRGTHSRAWQSRHHSESVYQLCQRPSQNSTRSWIVSRRLGHQESHGRHFKRTTTELDRHVRPEPRPDRELHASTDMAPGPLAADAFELLLNALKRTGALIETPSRPGDRRQAMRYRAKLLVRYLWRPGGEWFTGMTANISAAGLLFELDYYDPRVIRDHPAPPDDPLELTIELRTTPTPQSSAFIRCSATYVRTAVAAERVLLNAVGVAVYSWHATTDPPAG